MAYCCAPLCKSKFVKGADISFHEIPAEENIRKKWINVLSRKGWTPNVTSNYSRVCSKHFLSSDYKQGTKFKRLLKTAVPSQFPDYPEHKRPPKKKVRTSLAVEKRNSLGIQHQSFSSVENSNDEWENSVVIDEERNSVSDKCDSSIQVDLISFKRNVELNYLKKKDKRKSERIQQLQDQFDEVREKLQDLESNSYVKAILNILKESENNNTEAVLLKNLVQNFDKKKPRYDDITIRECLMWKNCCSKGYEYARRNSLLKLPSRTTFSR